MRLVYKEAAPSGLSEDCRAGRGGVTLRQQFEPYFSGISAEGLDFSKDGQWVAYTLYPEGSLWRSKVDGSERLQLAFPPMKALLPRWSPDQKQIVFSAMFQGERTQNYLVPAKRGDPPATAARRAR